MHSIENPNAVHGVYSIGNQPVLLETPYVPSTAATHYRVTFSEDVTRFLDFMEVKDKIYKSGMDGFVFKPFDLDNLFDRIADAVEKKM